MASFKSFCFDTSALGTHYVTAGEANEGGRGGPPYFRPLILSSVLCILYYVFCLASVIGPRCSVLGRLGSARVLGHALLYVEFLCLMSSVFRCPLSLVILRHLFSV